MTRHPLTLTCAALITLVATPRLVHASKPPDLHLTLSTDDGVPPTHICVVTEADPPPDLVGRKADRLEMLAKGLCAPGGTCGAKALSDSKGAHSDSQGPLYFESGPFGVHDESELLRSVVALSKDKNLHECDYGALDCRPLFEFRGIKNPAAATLTCAANLANPRYSADKSSPTGERSGRVLVLGLAAQANAPFDRVQLKDLQLNGLQALLRVSHDVGNVDLVLSVLGGFYAPLGEVRFTRGGVDRELRVEARCQWTSLSIPKIATRDESSKKTVLPTIRLHVDDPAVDANSEQSEQSKQSKKSPEEQSLPKDQVAKCMTGSLQSSNVRLLVPFEPRGRKTLSLSIADERKPEKPPSPPSGKVTPPNADEEKPEEDRRWHLEARWFGPRPTSGECHFSAGEASQGCLSMSVRSLSFAWRADRCLYPRGTCPAASIASSGLSCGVTNKRKEIDDNGTCHYHCKAAGEASISFPTKIAFSRAHSSQRHDESANQDNKDVYLRWFVDLDQIEQQLAGYVDPDERTFELDTSEWHLQSDRPSYPCGIHMDSKETRECEALRDKEAQGRTRQEVVEMLRKAICPSRPAHDDIFAVEFLTADGLKQRVEIDSVLLCSEAEGRGVADAGAAPPGEPVLPALVKLPRVSCNEPIRYRFIGERDYYSDSVAVIDGALRIPHPMKTARVTYFSLALLPAAFQSILHPTDLRTSGPRILWTPAIEGSLVFRPRRQRARGWRLNLDLTVMGSVQPFLGVTDSNEPRQQRAYFVRYYPGFSFLSPWLGNRARDHYTGAALALGAGLQIGIGHPLFDADALALGRVAFPLLAARFDARIRLAPHIEIVVSPRVLFGEPVVRFHTDFHGQPARTREGSMLSFLLPLGVAFVW
ncbi:MAG: hypothetical protein H6710_17665 [Myxococcales bacterium]|nr:hypothetical protein [Myxococcales bacterium]